MSEQPHIKITFDKNASMYVISDEDGEFARACSWPQVGAYVNDLLAGPGTCSMGSLFDRTIGNNVRRVSVSKRSGRG